MVKDVFEQLIKLDPQQFDFNAGEKYREYLIPHLENSGRQKENK
jgi:hypothetical protein